MFRDIDLLGMKGSQIMWKLKFGRSFRKHVFQIIIIANREFL